MNKIIERHFIVGRDRKLSNLIIKYFGSNWSEEYMGLNGHIVFIDQNPNHVIFATVWSGSAAIANEQTFTDYLKTIDYSNFYDLLVLVSTYNSSYGEIEKKTKVSPKIKNLHLDKILKETNGLIVYRYQLENLFIMATGCELDQAITFRKNINKKLYKALLESKKMKLFGTNLQAIMEDRMPRDGVWLPCYSQTYKLYQYLNL